MTHQLGAGHLGEVVAAPRCRPRCDSTVWCGAPAVSQASAEVRQVGRGSQTARATGSRRQRLVGGRRRRSRWRPAGTGRPGRTCRPRRPGRGRRRRPAGPGPRGRRCPAGGSPPSACRRRCVGQTSSMCAPRIFSVPGRQVVGVVLHERRAAGQPGRHRLERAQQHRGLPVALAAEAVAVGHQPLHGEAGQLAQPAEVLEVGGERAGTRRPRGSAAGPASIGRRSAATRAGRRRAAARRPRRRRPRTPRPARRPRRRRPRRRRRPGR